MAIEAANNGCKYMYAPVVEAPNIFIPNILKRYDVSFLDRGAIFIILDKKSL